MFVYSYQEEAVGILLYSNIFKQFFEICEVEMIEVFAFLPMFL